MPDSMYYHLVQLINRDIAFVDDILKWNKTDYIAQVAFNTQQILEKTFKLVLYSCTLSSQRVRNAGHSLSTLATMVENQGITVPDFILVLVSKVSTWESATRYDDCYSGFLDVKTVLNAYFAVKRYASLVINGY